MEPHTALLCDAHVWLLAECPICTLEREITMREGADRAIERREQDLARKNDLIDRAIDWDEDEKEYTDKIDWLMLHKIIDEMRSAREEKR